MRKQFTLFWVNLAAGLFMANAQSPYHISISTTGCTLDVYCLPGRFDTYDLEDGSTVFADDCEKDGVSWGIYCVKLKNPIADLEAAQDTLVTYLDFLKLDYGIVRASGYDKGHRLNKNDSTRGIFDTWDDAEKNKWKVKAWTDGRFICVLHAHSEKELPEKKTELFFESLRFPGTATGKKKN